MLTFTGITCLMKLKLLTTAIACSLLLSPCSQAQNAYYDQGVRSYQKGDFQNALRYFAAASKQGETGDCLYYQGLCFQQLGNLPRAKAIWKFTAANFPNTASAQAASNALSQIKQYSQGNASSGQPATTAATTSAPRLSQVVEVPFVRLSSGHIIVRAAVNGQPIDMMFDTGAADCFFRQDDFDKMGLKVPSGERRRYLGVGGEITATVVPVRLSLGGFSRQLGVSVQDPDFQRTQAQNNSTNYPLLGENFFGDLVFQIDSSQNVIRFLPSAKDVDGETVPVSRDNNNLIVTVKVNGRECPMILDTGADTVCFTDKHLANLGINRPVSADAGFSGGVGGKRLAYMFTIDSISMGSVEKKNVKAAVALDSTMDRPLLGASFLKGLVLTFDPASKYMKVSR